MANSGIITTGSTPALLKAKGKTKKNSVTTPQGSVKDRIGAVKMNCVACGSKVALKDIDQHMKDCNSMNGSY